MGSLIELLKEDDQKQKQVLIGEISGHIDGKKYKVTLLDQKRSVIAITGRGDAASAIPIGSIVIIAHTSSGGYAIVGDAAYSEKKRKIVYIEG